MTRKKRRSTTSPLTIESRKKRVREVRDLYNKLRRRYNTDTIDEFFRTHYFLQPRTVEAMLRECDTLPVSNPSLIYQQAMRDDFVIL